MHFLNRALLTLVEVYGLKAVVEALVTTCKRRQGFVAEMEAPDESDGTPDAWATDAETINRVLPLIINGDGKQ